MEPKNTDMEPQPVLNIRPLLMAGIAVLSVGLLALGGSCWYALKTVDQGLNRISDAWRQADGVMEMNIGTLKTGWAASLSQSGQPGEALLAFREAQSMFNKQAKQVAMAGWADTHELNSARELFGQMQGMVTGMLEAEAGAGVTTEDRDKLVQLQRELDILLTDLEERGDQQMEAAWAGARNEILGALKGNLMLVVGTLLLWIAFGAYLARRVIHGLSGPARRIAHSTELLTESAQYQVKSAMEQVSAAVQISTTMQELLASYNNLTERSRDMVQTSKAAADECHKGHAFLSKSQEGMGQIKAEVERITEHMSTLEEKTHQITSVLEIINEMGSQTNLLSINATIEAAGAGEAGRRFAVVAEEIRLLAERAVESTEEIRTLIEDIQETARVTNAVTIEGELAVDRGLEDAARVADNFNALLTLVTQTVDAVQTIEATAREQGNAVSQVSEAVEALSSISSESESHSSNTLETVKGLAMTAQELKALARFGKRWDEAS